MRASQSHHFAVCPMVEGALLRFLLRMGESSDTAVRILQGVHSHPRVSFWPDNVSYLDLDCNDLRGHRQVTDVYLAGLAASQGAGSPLSTVRSASTALTTPTSSPVDVTS
ncbi:MAG TPA: hypothetical protein VFY98_14230 [Intrasporangium sp.]|nr:hypothetical protein [Intrasporangium sp.]